MATRNKVGTDMYFLLLVLSLAGVGAALKECPETFVAELDELEASANSACEVTSLDFLAPLDPVSNTGASQFCNADCTRAIALITRLWSDTDSSLGERCDLGDYNQRRSLHEQIYYFQLECNPPNQQCVDIYFEYLYWVMSAQGQECGAEMQATRDPTLLVSDANSRRKAFCASTMMGSIHDADTSNATCGDMVYIFLGRMADKGCSGWPAFVSIRQDMDLFCSQVDAATDLYCETEYVRLASFIAEARNASQSIEDREIRLNAICSPCFHEIQKIKRANLLTLRVNAPETELCLTDPTVQSTSQTPRFCLPRFESGVSAAADVNDEAANVCDQENIGRCAKLIWSHRLRNQYLSLSEIEVLNTRISSMCTFNSIGAACHAVTQDLAQGVFQESDPQEPRPCTPTSVLGECQNPTLCQNWFDSNTQSSSVCPNACQDTTERQIRKFGCCFYTWKQLLGNLTTNSDEKFARIEFLEDRCCLLPGETTSDNACQENLEPACPIDEYRLSLSLILEDIPYDWVRQNLIRFNNSVTTDIARNLGILPETITINLIEPPGEDNSKTQVSFIIGAPTIAEGDTIKNYFEAKIDANEMYFDLVQNEYRTSACDDSSNDFYCLLSSSASALKLSPVIVFLTTFLFSIFH